LGSDMINSLYSSKMATNKSLDIVTSTTGYY
jgi:hypothetical protein